MTPAELYALHMTGFEPIKVVFGTSAISMGARGFGRSIRALFVKGEMTAVSSTAQTARENALALAEEAANKLGADSFLVHSFETVNLAEVVQITCTGTALKKVGKLIPMPMATATS